jgi:hypothetical protein
MDGRRHDSLFIVKLLNRTLQGIVYNGSELKLKCSGGRSKWKLSKLNFSAASPPSIS